MKVLLYLSIIAVSTFSSQPTQGYDGEWGEVLPYNEDSLRWNMWLADLDGDNNRRDLLLDSGYFHKDTLRKEFRFEVQALIDTTKCFYHSKLRGCAKATNSEWNEDVYNNILDNWVGLDAEKYKINYPFDSQNTFLCTEGVVKVFSEGLREIPDSLPIFTSEDWVDKSSKGGLTVCSDKRYFYYQQGYLDSDLEPDVTPEVPSVHMHVYAPKRSVAPEQALEFQISIPIQEIYDAADGKSRLTDAYASIDVQEITGANFSLKDNNLIVNLAPGQMLTMEIFIANGKTRLQNKTISKSTTVDLSSLARGGYYIKLSNQNGYKIINYIKRK